LSNAGLHGNGIIGFVGSTTYSSDIIFYPDSTIARIDSFKMNSAVIGGAEFPTVRGSKDKLRWLPQADSFIIKMDTISFKMFDLKTSLKGTLVLQSTGLRGSGNVDWADATLSSNDIDF